MRPQWKPGHRRPKSMRRDCFTIWVIIQGRKNIQTSVNAGADLDCRTGRTCDSQHSVHNNIFGHLASFSNLYYIESALRWIFLFAFSR